MNVTNIMKRSIISITENEPIKEAAKLMLAHKVSGLPVVSDDNSVIGMITEEDIIRAIFPSYEDLGKEEHIAKNNDLLEERMNQIKDIPVKEKMSTPCETISEDTPIMQAASVLLLKKFKRIPVVKDRKLVGLVSRKNILENIFT